MTLASRALGVGVLFAMLLCRSSASFVNAATLSCGRAATLDDLGECITAQMPQESSRGYFPPTARERADWRSLVRTMLDGTCEPTLPASLTGIVERRLFRDDSNGRRYCVLMEVLDADANGRVDR